MPNHTDVRATFFGRPDDIERLRRACRELRMRPREEMARAASWSGWAAPPAPFNLRAPRAHVGPYGALPPTGDDCPITLRAGVDMPASLEALEESLHQLGPQAADLLNPKKPFHRVSCPRHPKLEACKTRESALAWIEARDPGAIRDGKRLLSNLREHGATGWYDWSINNWSTKWLAVHPKINTKHAFCAA